MKITRDGDKLSLSEIRELSALTCGAFRRQLLESLSLPVREVRVDLGETRYMDCRGVGALAGLRKEAKEGNRTVFFLLANGTPEIRRLVKLAGLEEAVEPGSEKAATTMASALPPRVRVSSTVGDLDVLPAIAADLAGSSVVTLVE